MTRTRFGQGGQRHLLGAFPRLPNDNPFNRLERAHQAALVALGGFHARLTAKEALHNFRIWLNKQVGRHPLEFADWIAWQRQANSQQTFPCPTA